MRKTACLMGPLLLLFLSGCIFSKSDFEGAKCECADDFVCVEVAGERICKARDDRDLCPRANTYVKSDGSTGQYTCVAACNEECLARVGCDPLYDTIEVCAEPEESDDMGRSPDMRRAEDMNMEPDDMGSSPDMSPDMSLGDMDPPSDMEEPLCPIAGGLDCQCRENSPECDGSLVCDSDSSACRLPTNCTEIGCNPGQLCDLPEDASSQGVCKMECTGTLVFDTETGTCKSTQPPRYDCPEDRQLKFDIRAVCIEPIQSFTPGPTHQSSAMVGGKEHAVRGAIRAPFGGGTLKSSDSRRAIQIGLAR